MGTGAMSMTGASWCLGLGSVYSSAHTMGGPVHRPGIGGTPLTSHRDRWKALGAGGSDHACVDMHPARTP